MLGLQGIKGSLDPGADADLVIFSEVESDAGSDCKQILLDEVWKFGTRLCKREIVSNLP